MKRWTLHTISFFIALFASCTTNDPQTSHVKNDSESELVRQRKCIYIASAEMHQFQRMQDLWLGNESSELSIIKTYLQLSNAAVEAIETLRAQMSQSVNSGNSLSNLAEQITRLDGRQTEILNAWNKLTFDEHSFIRSLWILERGLDGLQKNLSKISAECQNTGISDVVSKAADESQKMSLSLAVMRASIQKNQINRPIILNFVMSAIRLKIKSDFSLKVGIKIDELTTKIDSVLAASNLLGDLQYWWVNRSYTGSEVEDTIYLQYLEPMRGFSSDLSFLDDFKERSTALSSSNPLVVDISRNLNSYRHLIEERQSELQTKGWSGQLDRQKLLVARRKSIIEKYPENCRAVILLHEKEASKVLTMETYQAATQIYHSVVDRCKGITP